MAYDLSFPALLPPHAHGVVDHLILTDARGFMLRNWWWLLAVLLTLAFAGSLVWYVRRVSLRRLPVPGFFLIALLIHVCLGFATFYVHFGEVIVRQIRRELRPIVVAPRLSPDETQQEPAAEGAEKIAELTAADAVKADRIDRQATESPNLAVPSQTLAPELAARADPIEPHRIVAALPRVPVQENVPSLVRPPTSAPAPQEQARLEPPAPAPALVPSMPERVEVSLGARPTDSPPADVSQHLPRLPQATRPAPSELHLERTRTQGKMPTVPQERVEVARAAPRIESSPAEADFQSLAAPAETPSAERDEPISVEVDRGKSPARVASQGAMRPLGLPREPAPLRPATDLAARVTVEQPIPVADEPVLGVQRAVRPAATAAAPDVATEALAPAAAQVAAEALPERVPIGPPQRAVSLESASQARVPGAREGEGLRVQPANVDLPRERARSSESMAATTAAEAEPERVQRRDPLASPVEQPEPAALAEVAPPVKQTAESPVPPASGVEVDAKPTTAPPAEEPYKPAADLAPPRMASTEFEHSAAHALSSPQAASPVAVPKAVRPVPRDAAVPDTESIALLKPELPPRPAFDAARAAVEVKPKRVEAVWPGEKATTTAAHRPEDSRRSPEMEILARETTDVPPTFDPLAVRLARRSAHGPQLLYAEDAVGLQAMFRLRRDELKREAVTALGGSDQSLEAIRLGLAWLARHQHADGYWSLNTFHNAQPGKSYTGQGSVRSDSAATALALLPFLGDGQTHLAGEHQAVVQRGIAWLVARQGKDGELVGGQSGQTRMYAHALATIALCEAYGMTQDTALREPAERAIAFVVAAQHKPSGGWRYQPNQSADTSVVGWQVLAVKSGQMAGVEVSGEVLEGVKQWLGKVEGGGREKGRFRYQPGRPISPAMTAEALLCLQFMGTPRHDARLESGVKYLLEHLPQPARESSYYWYYATQVMYHMQGEPWQKWNEALRDMLVRTQIREGHLAGTWDPKDQWERSGGRLYATSLRLLMLEVYYRHLPLYQVLSPGN